MFIRPQRFFRNADPGEGAGGGANPDANNPDPNKPAAGDPGAAGGDGGEGGDPPGNEGDPDPNAADPAATAAAAEEVQQFFAEVEQHWGRSFEVQYPEGVDPLSPQGVFIREQALFEHAQTEFEQRLQELDPRGYEYLLHRRMGGADDAFFTTTSPALPDAEVLKGSVDLQKQLIRQDLLEKKVPKAYVDSLVNQMATDGQLEKESLRIHTERQAAEAQRLIDKQAKFDRDQQELEQKIDTLNKGLTKTLTEDLKLVVPAAKQAEYLEFFTQNLRTDENNNFVVTLPVDPAKLKSVMQAVYLVQTGGDLSGTVQRAAGQQQVRRLRSAVSANQSTHGQGTAGGNKPRGLTDVW